MSDEIHGRFCRNCGDPIAENTIYCENCSYNEGDDPAGTNQEASERTLEDVEGTRSWFLANVTQLILMISFGALFLSAVVELVRKYAFGATDTNYFLAIVAIFVLVAVTFILDKKWTAFRLLGSE